MNDGSFLRPQFLDCDGLSDLHCDGHRFGVELHVREELEGGGQFFASHAVAFQADQWVVGGLVPDDAAHEDGKNRRLWRHADEDADAVGPVVQRLERARINIWVGFDLARGEGERRAACAQVRADLSHEGHARGRIIFQVEELFRCVGERHEERAVEGDDLQAGAVEGGEQGEGVGHAGVVG